LGAFALIVGVTTSSAKPVNSVAAQHSVAKVVMPNVVGMRMDRATRRLHNLGLRVNEECSGLFGCIIKANWWICTQNPRPGRKLNRYTVVLIYGKRQGDC
jgi:beta-lactam-binding protein with PASTA domain